MSTNLDNVKESVSNFVAIVMAKMTGDKNKEIAVRNEKKAKAALKGQISALESEVVNREEALEEAQERFNAAKYPVEPIGSSEHYIKNLVNASKELEKAEEELAAAEESLTFFKDQLESL